MKDVLTALTAEVFKPLMTVLLPGTVGISTFITYFFLRYHRLRELADIRRVETTILIALFALIVGEVIEDLGSRVEYCFDCRLRKKTDKPEYSQFDTNWWRYLRFAEQPGPIAVRYIRAHVIRLKFELGMSGALLLTAGGLWLLPLTRCFSLLSSTFLLLFCSYFCWEASETHELLAKVRHEIFGEEGLTAGRAVKGH